MQYRLDKKSGNKLSVLGYGCMRFPQKNGAIDMEKTEELILNAYNNGVNYYDTAYIYDGSEVALGKVLKNLGIRKDIFIATKLPLSHVRKREDFDKYFNAHLERLQTDYIDYYLMHNINSCAQWQKIVDMGVLEWAENLKKVGKIKHLGFSFHGTQNDFISVINSYDWDFTQIQYNYVNINFQAGMKGLHEAQKKGIPVIIMEPLLGGKLASGLKSKIIDIMEKTVPNQTPVKWALRWLLDQEGVTTILSGMSHIDQVKENLVIADESGVGCLTEKEKSAFEDIITEYNKGNKINCTGCSYCLPCPKNINIPALFHAYNSSYNVNWHTGEQQYMTTVGSMTGNPSFASNCIGCNKCTKHCPQGLNIPKELKRVKRRLQIPFIKQGLAIYLKFVGKKK